MENEEMPNEETFKELEKKHRRGKIIGGLMVVAIGTLFLLKEIGTEIPAWIFTWQMGLIALGIIIAVKHKFAHAGWPIMVGVGVAFLINDIYPDIQIRPYLWPALIILLGLIIIFKPRRSYTSQVRRWKRWEHHNQFHKYGHRYGVGNTPFPEEPSKEDVIESIAFMASVKKNILSKNFKGGDVTNVFGGTELNLMQADFQDKISLELTQVFGGTKLVVPAHWDIKSELVTVFGSVEDKRPILPPTNEPKKTILLTGTTVFGGIEIRSY